MAESYQLKAIITAVDKLSPTLKNITRAVKVTHKSLRDIGSAGGELMRNLGLPAGLAFGAVAYGAIRAARSTMDYAGSIQDAADRSGASVESYQALVNMMGQVGGTAEDAQQIMLKFNKGMADAAAGADQGFAGLMRKLNIPLKDASGNIRSLTDVLPQLADAFATNTNPAVRTRMAFELMGKSGSKLVPVLTQGGAAMSAMIAEMYRLGMITSGQAIAALDGMGDSVGALKVQINSQLATAMANLAPVIQPIIKDMGDWIAANKEWIQESIKKTLIEITTALKEVDWKQFGRDVKAAAISISNAVERIGGMKSVLIGFGIAWLAGPVAAVLSIGGAVLRAVLSLGSLLFTVKKTAAGYTVMGAIPAINTALGASFIWLRTQVIAAALVLRMGGVAGLASAVMSSIGAAAVSLGTFFMSAGKAVLMFSRALLLSPFGIVMALATAAYLIYDNWETIKKWFTDFFSWLPKKITQIAEYLKAFAPDWLVKMFSGGNVNVNATQSQTQTPLARSGALGMAAGKQQLTGDMTVRFENAPAGMRVDQGKTNQPFVGMNADVGYRSLGFAL